MSDDENHFQNLLNYLENSISKTKIMSDILEETSVQFTNNEIVTLNGSHSVLEICGHFGLP